MTAVSEATATNSLTGGRGYNNYDVVFVKGIFCNMNDNFVNRPFRKTGYKLLTRPAPLRNGKEMGTCGSRVRNEKWHVHSI